MNEINFLNCPGKFPLVDKYLGAFLRRLVDDYESQPFEGRFILGASYSKQLEKRLSNIEPLGITGEIIKEVGNPTNAEDLDKRLLDAWAELRVIDQLQREGFTDIKKVIEVADLYAQREDQRYAFQVTRRNSPLERHNIIGVGINEIHDHYDDLLRDFFWTRLQDKNGKFKRHQEDGVFRVIAVVTSDEHIQESPVRHIACQQIRNLIFDPAFGHINFEEILWLPDIGDGAWFNIGKSSGKTRCYADWHDEFGRDWDGNIYRREVDLDNPYPNRSLMNDIFLSFSELIDARLMDGVYTTEDSVRYTFFLALIKDGRFDHTDVVLEYPHPTIERAQIDTLTFVNTEFPSMAFEFKYDRRNPGNTNQNRTQRAGAVFKDLFRLARVPGTIADRKYFIYLTDDEMASYFNNPRNGFARMFALRPGGTFLIDDKVILRRAKTFQDVVHSYQVRCKAIGAFQRDLSQSHTLRIFEIQT